MGKEKIVKENKIYIMKYLNKIVDKLKFNKVKLEGCKQNEIKSLENKINRDLPLCYKECRLPLFSTG